jgi:predicted HTH domain antitoxin
MLILCFGRSVNEIDTGCEGCVEGKRMNARLKDYSLRKLFSISETIKEHVSKMIEEVKTISFCGMSEIATFELFLEMYELMEEDEEDSEMILLFTLLVEEVVN